MSMLSDALGWSVGGALTDVSEALTSSALPIALPPSGPSSFHVKLCARSRTTLLGMRAYRTPRRHMWHAPCEVAFRG